MQLRVHLKSLHHALYHQSDALVLPVVFQIYTPQLQPLLDSLLSPQLHRSCATHRYQQHLFAWIPSIASSYPP